MSARRVRLVARAKLTLSLHVVGVRPDGYHDLEALAVSLHDPHDLVTVDIETGGGGVHLAVGGLDAEVPTDDTNLVVRAARAVLACAGTRARLAIRLEKRIAAGAGLGGGSADAAATLVALRDLSAPALDDEALLELAAALGSDVPFCVRGGAAWMRGRGEELEPVAMPPLAMVVVTPRLHCPTPAVYRTWDELGGPQGRAVPSPPALAHLAPALRNDLEPAAEALEPRLAQLRDVLEEATGRPALLAGSGSSYVVVGDDGSGAALEPIAAAARAAAPTARVVATTVAPTGVAAP